MVEDLLRAGSDRGARLDHRRQLGIVQLDRLRGVARLIERLRDHKSDRLTDMANLADGEHRPRRVVARLAVAAVERVHAGHVAELVGLHIGPGQNQQHPGHAPRRGGIDFEQPGMRDRRAQNRGKGHAGERDVVGVAAFSGEKPLILVALERLTDSELHGAWHSSAGGPQGALSQRCLAFGAIATPAGWRRRQPR